jgi:hypothetical protein
MNNQKKSPLKHRPLRYSGQSLDEELDKLINDRATNYAVLLTLTICFTFFEWFRYYHNTPPAPKTLTGFALIISAVCIYKLWEAKRQARFIRQGRDGERIVAEYLDDLREEGCRIFHDVIGDNFNLDHVIVSEKGIYVIETKTYSKPVKGNSKILYNGETIVVNGIATKEPIIQVTAAARWLREILKQSTGKSYAVKPVVVFPEWYVEQSQPPKKSEVWVLNPKALKSFISNENDKIKHEDMMLATFHITQYVRSKVA